MPDSLFSNAPFWTAVFIFSLFVLLKSSQYFTESAERIGVYFGIPQFIVGVTIIAIGTSLPELVSSIIAVLEDSSEIVIGNVVGSNIANICLIIGVAAVVGKELTTKYDLISVDLPLFAGSSFLFALMIWDGRFSFGEALLCIVGIVLYMFYAVSVGREQGKRAVTGAGAGGERRALGWTIPVVLALSAGFIYLSAKYTVESVVRISEILNVGKEIIAVSAVALGTSLPELSVSVTAARKGKSELAIGNVLGSNIFNSFAVMGIPALFGAVVVPPSILGFSLQLMLMVTVLYVFIAQDKKITKWEGALFLLIYCFFIGRIFNLL